MLIDLIPSESLLPGLLHPYMMEGDRERVALVSSSYKDTNHIMGASILMTSPEPNYSAKASLPNNTALGIRTSRYEFWGDANIQFIAHILPFVACRVFLGFR